MISKIQLSHLQNAEFLAFFKSLLGFIGDNATVSAAVSGPKTALAKIISRIDELFKNDPASPLTETLQGLDAERDRYISGLAKICDGFRNSPSATERDAAALLFRNIEVYGGATEINDMGINAETTTVDSLLNDWTNKPELSAAVTTLHLGGWVTALQTANTNYSKTYGSRTTQLSAADTSDTIKGKRAEAITAWYELRKKIDANRELAANTTDWDTVTGQINALIDQYNHTLAVRSGRAVKKGSDAQGGEGQAM